MLNFDVIGFTGRYVIFIQIGQITDFYICFKKPGGIAIVNTNGYPPFSKVKIQIIECNRLGCSFAQGLKSLVCRFVIRILNEKFTYAISLFDYIARNDPFCYFIGITIGVEIDPASESFEDVVLTGSGQLRDIFDV